MLAELSPVIIQRMTFVTNSMMMKKPEHSFRRCTLRFYGLRCSALNGLPGHQTSAIMYAFITHDNLLSAPLSVCTKGSSLAIGAEAPSYFNVFATRIFLHKILQLEIFSTWAIFFVKCPVLDFPGTLHLDKFYTFPPLSRSQS